MSYFKLLRPLNLLIAAVLMYFVRFQIIEPFMLAEHPQASINELQWALIVLSYVLLMAGGYALNDYYDIGMDEINRPEKTILRTKIPLSRGRNLFYILSAIGIATGMAAAILFDTKKLLFLPLVIALMYWFYSTKYKREYISGNIVVSLLAAFGVLIPWLYMLLHLLANGNLPVISFKGMNMVVGAYAFFAFFVTFIREVVKDIPDTKGDNEFACRNLPIVLGIAKTKKILIWLSMLFLTIIAATAYYCWTHKMEYLAMFMLFIMAPLWIYFIMQLKKADSNDDFKTVSTLLKIIIVTGILSMQLVHFNLNDL